jgi:predicted flap endonuclease-1-like 5' DNA nuclease
VDQIIHILTQNATNKTAAIIEITFMLTVAFIIGALTVWFYHKVKMMILMKKVKRLSNDVLLHQEESKRLKNEKDKLSFSYKTLTDDNNKLMAEHKALKKENDKLKEELNLERQKPLSNASAYKEDAKKLDGINKRLESEINTLSIQIQRLKEENIDLRSAAESYKQKYQEDISDVRDGLKSEKYNYVTELRELKIEVQKAKVEREKAVREYDVALLNSQILKEENENLKNELDRAKAESERIKAGDQLLKDRIKQEQKRLEVKEDDFELKKQLLLQSIGVVAEADKDDIRQIRGIGPFIEKKLNKIGVYTVAQIANFTKDDIQRATELIKYFPGRIERDNWILQAKEIIRVKDKNLELIKKFEV